jgi:hypothetical protein
LYVDFLGLSGLFFSDTDADTFLMPHVGLVDEIFPQYIAPTLQAVNPFCLKWQDSLAVTRLFGGALAHEGL